MADKQGRIEIDAVVDNALQGALTSMGDSIRNILQVTSSLSASSLNTTNASTALSKALGNATSASATYAKSTHNLARNQAVLAKHFRDAGTAASQLDAKMRSNTQATAQEKAAVDRLVVSLRAQEAARKGVMKYSMATDLRRQSDALNQLANRYSMSGNRMSMALTLPIVSFMRSSFANYRRVEVETVRTTKLISDSYTRAADVVSQKLGVLSGDNLYYTKVVDGTVRKVMTLEGAQNSLGKQLDKISLKYGVARELVQGLAGDYAELGISNVDTLAGLTSLTAEVEKLGNLDVTSSQEFIKSIFQTLMRIKRDNGSLQVTSDGFIDYGDIIGEVTEQLALFNLIENKTQLSLRDVAKGFPELTAAATSFGLSMTEATALMVPMVSAGFQVGASANSVKVSLQRVVDLTKENSTMIQTLKDSYKGFNVEAGVGVGTIQKLADSFNSMKKGSLGAQGTLEFFSSLFGVRQGPRMEVAIQNMAQFQDQLSDIAKTGTVENKLLKQLERYVQESAFQSGFGDLFGNMKLTNFEDISEVIRMSQEVDPVTKELTDKAKVFQNARNRLASDIAEKAKYGNDVLSQITTEAGRAFFVGALGSEEAARKYEEEVKASLNTVENRYQKGREAIKAIGRQIVPVLGTILQAVLPILLKINEVFEKMPSWMKSFIGLGLIVLAAIGPVMKLVGGMFQLKSAMLGIKAGGGFFGKMRSQTQEISAEMLVASDAAARFKNKLTEVGGKFYLQGTKKEIKELERLMQLEAVGGSKKKIARLEKRLGMTGRQADLSGLSPKAQDDLMRANPNMNIAGYREDSFRKAGFPAKVMTAEAAGKKIGEAFLAVLKSFQFDPAQIQNAVRAATATATATATPVATPTKRTGTPRPPSTPPPAPPSGPTPPTGGGGSPVGPRPSAPVAPAAPAAPTNSNPMPVTVVNPAPTTPAHPPLPTTVPVNLRRTTLPLVSPAIVNNNIPTPVNLIPKPQVPAVKEVSSRIPDSLLDRSIPAPIVSAVKEVTVASKESLSAMALGIKKAPVESLRILAKSLDIVKVTVNGQIKPISQVGVKALRSILLDYMKGIKDGLVFGKDVAAEKRKNAEVKARGANAPPSDTKPATTVTTASTTGAKNAQAAQAQVDTVAVKTQAEADVKALQPLTKAAGKPLEGISPKAQKYASTVEQMYMNAQISVNKPIDEIINALNLVGNGSKRVPFVFTKEKFLQLAEILGIQLPPIFNKMGELVDANGKSLSVTKEGLVKVIQSLTRTAKAPEILGNIAGQTVLEMEAEVNKALALGKGSRLRFNLPGLTGKIQDAFSRSFTTSTGSIFSDVAGKAASQTGAQKGDVDYTRVGFRDLGYKFKASRKPKEKVEEEKPIDRSSGVRKVRRLINPDEAMSKLEGFSSDVTAFRKARQLINNQIDKYQLRLSRELVLSTKRSLDALLQYVPDSRAKSALIRKELTTTAGYKELISRKMTVPKTAEAKARKLAQSPVDKMSESDYSAFNAVRQKGIEAAKKLSEQRKNLFRAIAKDVKIPIEIIEEMLSAMNQNDGKLGTLKGVAKETKKTMRDSFKTLEATLKKAGITVAEALVQPALATSLIAANQKVLPSSGGMRLTNDQAIELAGGKDNTLKPIVDAEGRVTKATYKFEERLNARLAAREKELNEQGLKDSPRVKTAGIKAAIEKISQELAQVATEQVAGILREIESVKATTIKPQERLNQAKARIAKINTFKGADLKSDEAKEILGGKTKKAYIEEQQAIVNTAQLAINSAKTEIEARELKIKAIEKEVETQRRLLSEKAKEMLPGGNPKLVTGSIMPFVPGAPQGKKGKAAQDSEYWKRVQPEKIEATTPLVTAATAVSQDVAAAEETVRLARERLNELKGLKTDISGSEEGKPFAKNAQERVKIAIKKLKVKAENIDLEIDKQQTVLNTAQTELNTLYQRRNAGGGGAVGGMSMRDDPFMGMAQRGPRMPQIGPKLAFIDKGPGSITGGVRTVYEEIRQALNVPADVMQQVVNQLRSGFTDATGKVRGAQNVVTNVGTALRTEITADLTSLIEALRATIGTADMTVENVRDAIIAKRSMIGNLKAKTSSATSGSSAQIGLPKVSKPRSGTTPEYDAYIAQRDALVGQIKAEITAMGTNQTQLLRIHADTLRQLARSYGVEASIVNSGNKGRIVQAILALESITKSEEAFFTNNLRTIEQAAAAVQAVRPATPPRAPATVAPVAPAPAPTASPIPAGFMNPMSMVNAMRPAVPMPRNLGPDLQAKLQDQLARSAQKRLDIATRQARIDAQLERSFQKRLAIQIKENIAASQAVRFARLKANVMSNIKASEAVRAARKAAMNPPEVVPTKISIMEKIPKIDFSSIRKVFSDDFGIFSREVKHSGSMMKNILMQGYQDIRDAISTAPDPSRAGRLVRGLLNPFRLVEGGLSGFGKTFNSVFSPSRIEYLSRALGGTAPLMKYRKTDPLTGAPMPPITGVRNRLKAIPARTLMGVGKVVQDSNMFPNLQALLQQTYGAYMPTALSMGSGRQGRTALTQSGQRKTGMGGILDANLRRAGVPATRQVTNQAQNVSAQLFANITPSGFETGLTSIVQKISGFTNRLLTGSQKINSVLESVGRGVGMSLRVAGRAISVASVAAIPTMVSGYKTLGSATTKTISILIGNISGALGVVDALAQNSGSDKAKKFAERLRKGATKGAQVGSLQRDASQIDLANLTVKQKLGALAGIITVAGAQFGASSLKFTGQVGLAMTQLMLKLVPFGGTIMNIGAAFGKVGSGIMNTGKAMKTASSGVDTFKGKILAMGKAAASSAGKMVGKAGSGVKAMFFGTPAGADGQGGKKGIMGGLIGGAKGMMGGMKGTMMGGVGTAVSMLSYQFGMVGMIAGPVLTNIITKIASIPRVGGPIIILLMAIVGAFMLLKKTTSAWSQYSDGALQKFSDAWDKIKEIFKIALGPVFDFFASFLGGAEEGEKSTKDLGEKIGKFANKILEVLPKIQSFVEKYVVPALRQIMSGFKLIVLAVAPLFSAVVNFVKGVVKLFKGDFNGAMESGKKVIGNLKDAFIKVLKGITIILAPFIKAAITLLSLMVTTIINILEQIPIFFINMIRWMLKTYVQLIISGMVQPIIFVVDAILTSIATMIQWMIAAIKMVAKIYVNVWFSILKAFLFVVDKILEGSGALVRGIGGILGKIPFVGGKFKDMANSVGDSMGRAMDVWGERAQGAQNTLLDAVDAVGNGASNMVGRLKDVGNGLGNIAQAGQNALISGIDSIANWLTSKIGSASDFVAAGRNAINGFIDGLVRDNLIPKDIGKNLAEDLGETLMNDPTAAKAAGEAIKKAIGEAMSSLESSYFDAVIGNIGNAMSKIKEELSEILNKQKEDALKAYDDQISAIEALAEAEERLTATEEYESNRRQRIKDRELQRNNYQKERALAIYEGRVDDARNLDLEELKNSDDFNKEISDMDKSRQKELQGQNRSDAISIIRNNKEEASKLFDEAIKEFEDYVEEVTKNGAISEAQLTEQFTKIAAKAGEKSTAINDAFKGSFSALPGLIQTGLDPVTKDAGFFSTEMDKLVNVAKTKFGLDTANSGDTSSILGVTTAMLTSTSQGIPSVITAAFASGGAIQTAYGSALTELNKYIADKQDPKNENSLSAIYKKTIADANETMYQEALKAQRGMGSAFAAIVATINEKVKALTIAEAVKKGLEEAKKAAGEGAKEIGNEISNASTAPKIDKIWARLKTGKANSWIDVTANSAKYSKDAKYMMHYGGSTAPNFFKGGRMPYGNGGPTFGPMNQGIPATLHGGEFVIRKAAVDKYGLDMLNQLNRGIYAPKVPSLNIPMSNYSKIANAGTQQQVSSSESTHNYNFYVDNFIGETEWFNSMMKDYNMKVVPANQKQAGLESRVIKTYNGINRGL